MSYRYVKREVISIPLEDYGWDFEEFAQQGKVKLVMVLNDKQIFMVAVKCGIVGVENQFYQVGSGEYNVV